MLCVNTGSKGDVVKKRSDLGFFVGLDWQSRDSQLAQPYESRKSPFAFDFDFDFFNKSTNVF